MYPQPKVMILEVIFSSPFHIFRFCSLSKISSKSLFKLLLSGKHVYSFSILSMKQLIAFALTFCSFFQNLYFCCNVILLLFKMTLCVYKCGTVYMCVWVCHSVHVWMWHSVHVYECATVCMWRSENTFQQMVLFFYYVGARNPTQVFRPESRCSYLLSHVVSHKHFKEFISEIISGLQKL